MERLAVLAAAIFLAGCLNEDASGGMLPPKNDARVGPEHLPPTPPENEPPAPGAPLRMEGRFYAELMTPGVCTEDLTTRCGGFGRNVERPIFSLRLDHAEMANRTFSEWVVTATWTPTSPGSAAIYVRVVDLADERILDVVRGESPLEVRLPRDAMKGTGEYSVRIAPVETGFLRDQAVQVVLETR